MRRTLILVIGDSKFLVSVSHCCVEDFIGWKAHMGVNKLLQKRLTRASMFSICSRCENPRLHTLIARESPERGGTMTIQRAVKAP